MNEFERQEGRKDGIKKEREKKKVKAIGGHAEQSLRIKHQNIRLKNKLI